mgnify:CR=1 FL=1
MMEMMYDLFLYDFTFMTDMILVIFDFPLMVDMISEMNDCEIYIYDCYKLCDYGRKADMNCYI